MPTDLDQLVPGNYSHDKKKGRIVTVLKVETESNNKKRVRYQQHHTSHNHSFQGLEEFCKNYTKI
jgi:hypothetical protein